MSPLRLAILALAALSATDAARVAPSLHRLRGGATVTTVKAPGETYQALASAGVAKATMPMNKALHSAFMGGWYVAIGGVFALVVAGALDLPAPIKKLVIGLIFPIGLVFILQTGASLLTGNFFAVTAAYFEGKIDLATLLRGFGTAAAGNLAGTLTFAYLVKQLDLLPEGAGKLIAGIAASKVTLSPTIALGRAVLANWLVCMAIFLATEANDFGGKYLGIWSCIPMFVTIGLEHSVANAFFLPLGMLYGADVTPMQIVTKNLLIVALGNFIGGGLLHAGGLSYQFGKLGEDEK